MLDIAIISIFIILGFVAKQFFSATFSKKEVKILNFLWLYHVAFAILYYFYVNSTGGDARNYWFTVKENLTVGFLGYFEQGFGTYSMYAINYLPSGVLDLSFFTGSIGYAFVGYIGFIYLFLIFRDRIKYNTNFFNIPLFPIILFLPNLHFWTCNVGKDTLLFVCIASIFYAMKAPKKYVLNIIISLALAYFVRPHIAAFLVLSFGIGLILDGNLKMYYKIFFSVVMIGVFVVFFESVMSYLRIESFDLESISNYSEDKATKLSRDYTGSSVDISSYPFPLKVFTFLFRPLFFDINGPLAVIASIENLILLVLSVRLIRHNPIRLFRKADFFFRSLFIFFLLGTVSFSLILGNLGIMLRQKNMFIPALLFMCMWSFSYATELRLQKRSYGSHRENKSIS